ncbi:MAG: efflux RND transporter periplasmic adaptor subunit [Micropepsaceae bacterium]
MSLNRRVLAIIGVFALVCALSAYWLLQGADSKSGRDDKGKQPNLVTLTRATPHEFVDLLQAVGTAKANESVELTAKSTDTIAALNFKDGQKVEKDFAVAELSSREQTADLIAARADLKEIDQNYKRATTLAGKGFVSKANLDSLRASRDTAAAKVNAMLSRTIDRVIQAPFAGVLGLRRVSVGALVKPGDIVTTLDDISRIKVDFTISETQLAGLRQGQIVRATAAAFPGKAFTGSIDSIDTRVDTQSRTIAVRAIFANDDAMLLPGMTLSIGIESNKRTALALDERTLVPVEDKQFVYVVEDGNTAARREVKIGAREPGLVEVLTGIDPSMDVVLEGTLRLRPGAPVKVAGDKGSSDKVPGRALRKKTP